MTPSEQKERLDAEVEAIQAEIVTAPHHGTRAEEVEESGIAQAVSIRHEYVLAEELAFREIEREFGVPVQRNVAVGGDLGFDHIVERLGPITFLLVVVTEGLTVSQREIAATKTREMLKEASQPVVLRVYDFDELKEKYGIVGRAT